MKRPQGTRPAKNDSVPLGAAVQQPKYGAAPSRGRSHALIHPHALVAQAFELVAALLYQADAWSSGGRPGESQLTGYRCRRAAHDRDGGKRLLLRAWSWRYRPEAVLPIGWFGQLVGL